jgi:cold-inducible RNA-binding protein
MTIYAGNLPTDVTEEDLRTMFEVFGKVSTVDIIVHRFHTQPSGFGMIGMPIRQEAEKAIQSLNGTQFNGKLLMVNEAGVRTNR